MTRVASYYFSQVHAAVRAVDTFHLIHRCDVMPWVSLGARLNITTTRQIELRLAAGGN